MNARVPTEVVVVTGMSGAGRSTALRALEDLGFYCMDNLPPSVTTEALEHCHAGGLERAALGLDARAGAFLEQAEKAIQRLAAEQPVRVLFLDASDEALLRRFSSTRRPHPLSAHSQEAVAVLDGISSERERLSVMRGLATDVIDTTALSVHDLRHRMLDLFSYDEDKKPRMRVRVLSFGFKYGAPTDADLMFDVRFIKNPFFVEELRPLSGQDDAVRQYVFSHDGATRFLDQISDLLVETLPRYHHEGKSYLTIGIGCTGGRHRSVALSEALAQRLTERTDFAVKVRHRDVARERGGGG